MNYDFPTITHIDKVLRVIEGRKEFIVAEKDHYRIINYVISGENTFPDITSQNDAILRECRGLVFDLDGNIIARRFHKFFNVFEREETHSSRIDISKPHVILEKLDGSMITPIPIEKTFRLGTKMGVTDVSMGAEELIANKQNYIDFMYEMLAKDITPIFEYCSRKFRIVVDYPEERLVLLAARHNISGEYLSYSELVSYSEKFDLDLVQQYKGTVENMTSLVEDIRNETEGEGWIIRFDDGHMIKLKNETYVRLHKVKDKIRFEYNLVDVILREEIDDLKGFMLIEDLSRVNEYEQRFWSDVNDFVDQVSRICDTHSKLERKDFALNVANSLSPLMKVVAFRVLDGKEPFEETLNLLSKKVNNSKNFDQLKKEIIKSACWE
jgi:RNA ligase